jgi:acetoin utilization protein AcuB
VTLVSDAMERRVVTVPLGATVGEAADAARREGVAHVIVLDGEALAGVLCASDLDGAAPGGLVAECPAQPVLTVRPDAPLEDAASTMGASGVGCLPVVVGGLVLGLLDEAALERAGLASGGAHAGCHPRPPSRH